VAVGQAAVAGMKWLRQFYVSVNGAWDQSIVQWYESGEYFTASLEPNAIGRIIKTN
jgi:hypothetical protein